MDHHRADHAHQREDPEHGVLPAGIHCRLRPDLAHLVAATVTVTDTGSTTTLSPSTMRAVASGSPTTAGIPSSRATMAAWLSGPPCSVTSAASIGRTGLKPGDVRLVTSTSPGWMR